MPRRLSQPLVLVLMAALLEGVFLVLRGLHPLDAHVAELVAVALAGGLLYLVAAWRVLTWRHSTRAALAVVLFAAVVFRLTLLPLPPTLSDDAYRYVWEGQVQLAGYNPYLVAPADPEVAPLRPAELERLPGKDVPSAYPPLTQLLFRLAAGLDGLAAFKLLSVLFDLATLLLIVGVLRLRGRPPVRALVYGWCPLVVLEFAGSGHNDSLALCALLLAHWLIIRGRAGVSIMALAAATLSKWFAGVLVPVFLRRTRWWGAPLFAATAVVLSLPYLGAGANLLSGFATYAEKWRNNESLYALLMAATGQESIATGVALGVVGGLALHCALTRVEPLRAGFFLLAAVLLLAPSVFPWYVTWLVPFLCFYPNPGLLLFTVTILLSYHVLIDHRALGVWHYSSALVWLEYVPVYGLLLWSWWRRQGTPAD